MLTQVGGVIYLLSRLTNKRVDKLSNNIYLKLLYRLLVHVTIYCFSTFVIIPFLAKPLGRVPLPLTETNHLKPLNILTCLLNRHYVKPELKQTALEVALKMHDQFPGSTINYLDANFPFIDKFPLFPHLSHNDGKKLDLSFCYIDVKTNQPTNECPSFYGYGICEEPLPHEINTTQSCEDKGYRQYSILKMLTPQHNKSQFAFDQKRTKELLHLISNNPKIGKVFLEPHLKSRLKLSSDKIRFHGCQAVRHDDHVHIELE